MCVPVFLLAAGLAAAEPAPLDAVRAALEPLAGTSPVRGVLERMVMVERQDRPKETGRATLELAAGPDGISIGYPPGLLDAARAERADTDPEKAEPLRRTLENFDVLDVADMLNGATGLLTDLDGATVTAVADVEHEGRPARQLDLELQVRMSKADRKWLKRASRTMRLWTTPDGVPLGAQVDATFRVGLLFFNYDGRESRRLSYQRLGDRLVVTRREYRFDGEGLGEDQHNRSEHTLRLQGS